MGRKKLPENQRRTLRQYYLTPEERAQMDEFFNKVRGIIK